MQTARSARRTCSESLSIVEYTATASTSSSWSARITRTATSPRLATRTRLNGIERPPQCRLDLEQHLAELHGLAVLDVDPADDAVEVGLDLVHQLHRLEDAERLAGKDRRSLLHERWRSGRRRAVKGPHHRRLHANDSVGRWLDCGRRDVLLGRSRRRRRWSRCHRSRVGLLTAPDRDAHAGLLDRDLGDSTLLDDAHDLADPLGAALIHAAADQPLLAAGPAADGREERFGLLAEEREQEQLLLTRRQALRVLADVLEVDGRLELLRLAVGAQLDRAARIGVELARRRPEVALEEAAQLVDDESVAARREDVDQCLRSEDLSDGRSKRRPAGLSADPLELVEHLVEPVAHGLRAQVGVEGRDEAGRQVVLGGAHRDAGRERRDRLVADVLVDQVGGSPELFAVDTRFEPEPLEDVCEPFACDAMQDERDGVDGARDAVRPGPRGLERRGERVPRRALAVDPDREAARLADRRRELAGAVGLERSGRIVEKDPSGAELGQLARLLDERVGLARRAGAVDQARVELAA